MTRRRLWRAIIGTLTLAACSQTPAREYELNGQVLAVDQARQEITIRHGDIKGFMPGMTMPFKVKEPGLLAGRTPGDLVRATLVVAEADVYLRTLERTGHQAVAEPAPASVTRMLAAGDPVVDADLVDETGARTRLADLRGNAIAVTFMYTRCPLPNFCPLMDRQFKAVQDRITADGSLKGRARLLSVTFDPAFDTPAVLARHAARLEADPAIWSFLTGTREAVRDFAAQFGASTIGDDRGATEIAHNLRTAVIDRQGRLAVVLNGGDWTPDDLIAALRNAY